MSNVRKLSFDIKGYKTAENAERKITNFLEDYEGEQITYMIHVNDAGRFCPVAVHYPPYLTASLIHNGICVI